MRKVRRPANDLCADEQGSTAASELTWGPTVVMRFNNGLCMCGMELHNACYRFNTRAFNKLLGNLLILCLNRITVIVVAVMNAASTS